MVSHRTLSCGHIDADARSRAGRALDQQTAAKASYSLAHSGKTEPTRRSIGLKPHTIVLDLHYGKAVRHGQPHAYAASTCVFENIACSGPPGPTDTTRAPGQAQAEGRHCIRTRRQVPLASRPPAIENARRRPVRARPVSEVEARKEVGASPRAPLRCQTACAG